MMCTICRGKGYLICMRDDGYEAGIAALHEYPCYVVGRVVVS